MKKKFILLFKNFKFLKLNYILISKLFKYKLFFKFEKRITG
jgi:hypothetical protein